MGVGVQNAPLCTLGPSSAHSARQVRAVRSVRPSIYQTSARDGLSTLQRLRGMSRGPVAHTWQAGPGGII